MDTLLDLVEIVQEYPGVKALKGVSLSVRAGEVVGLVGENGAGKSTLIRVAAGIEKPVSGVVKVHGEERTFSSSSESQAAGIAVVSQEFQLVPELSVADNIFLGHEERRGAFLDRTRMRRAAADLLERLGLEIDPRTSVSTLTVGDMQLLEIARALSRDFEVLIMDEPTAALNQAEIERLHGIVERIAAEGRGIVYVSHHLEEIFALCDRVTVLRDGARVADELTQDLDQDRLVELMLGRRPEVLDAAARDHAGAEACLEVDGLHPVSLAEPQSFRVAAGEVLGIAGLVGSGRSEVTRALFGDVPVVAGTVRVKGREADLRSVRAAIASGIFMVSEDRKAEGLLPDLDVVENMLVSKERKALPLLERLLPLRTPERRTFEEMRDGMSLRVSGPSQLISKLSGGNQQKVLLARALQSNCSVLVLNEPTRGVDVGAKVEIYQLIRRLAEGGAAVIVSSSDVSELVAVADRCLVYFAGRRIAKLSGEAITEDNIVAASVGQRLGESNNE